MHQVLGEGGLAETAIDDDTVVAMYRDMVRARTFDERAIALQRRGWMSGYPPFRGQEASQIGLAHAMHEDDWFFPTYRSNAALLAMGVSPTELLLFRRGVSEFYTESRERPIFPQAVPIATQIPHATGAGMAANYVEADHAVVAYFGDGATSEGDFHEGLNFAGVFETPTLFFCENNHWAISLPRYRQTASETLAQKATAYGFEGVRVDGTDPLAVYDLLSDRFEEVRAGTPLMVESLTYRHDAHTTSDDPSRYRQEEELPAWRKADPLERYEDALREAGYLDADRIEAIEAEAEAELEDAIAAAESVDLPDGSGVIEDTYATPTPALHSQLETIRERDTRGDTTDQDANEM